MNLSSCIRQKLDDGSLVLPTLPAIGSKIISQIHSEQGPLELCLTLQTDPILCARVVSLSNSPHYRQPYKRVHAKNLSPMFAIQTIGTDALRSIVISFVLEQLFISSRSDITKEMNRDWDRRVRVASAALALNSHLDVPLDADKVLLFSMTMDVGILPCLYYIEELGLPLEKLDASLVTHVTKKLLQYWDLGLESEYRADPDSISCYDLYVNAYLFNNTPETKLCDSFSYLGQSVDMNQLRSSYREMLEIFLG
jgi:HD-like signal output (HDOD) protein